jgi:hypothetical protein
MQCGTIDGTEDWTRAFTRSTTTTTPPKGKQHPHTLSSPMLQNGAFTRPHLCHPRFQGHQRGKGVVHRWHKTLRSRLVSRLQSQESQDLGTNNAGQDFFFFRIYKPLFNRLFKPLKNRLFNLIMGLELDHTFTLGPTNFSLGER